MNLRTLLCTIAVIATLLLLVGCSPDRGSTDLSPIVYISETSQLRLARELLFRSYELTRMIADIQNGFALPSPQRDSSFHLTDNGYYVRTEYDTLAEMVRFVPDVWQGAATQADSLFYKWYVFGGDTTSHGVYWYQTQIARLVPASIPHLTGTIQMDYRFYQQVSTTDYYDYSYSFSGTFDQPGGTPPPIGGASYDWNGTAVTWESDYVPYRWPVVGTSRRGTNGMWEVVFTLDGYDFLQGLIDDAGVGTFRIGWDGFNHRYTFSAY